MIILLLFNSVSDLILEGKSTCWFFVFRVGKLLHVPHEKAVLILIVNAFDVRLIFGSQALQKLKTFRFYFDHIDAL